MTNGINWFGSAQGAVKNADPALSPCTRRRNCFAHRNKWPSLWQQQKKITTVSSRYLRHRIPKFGITDHSFTCQHRESGNIQNILNFETVVWKRVQDSRQRTARVSYWKRASSTSWWYQSFCREADEICALLEYYAAYGDDSLQTFWENLSVIRVSWPL